jgi:hypothetical protein
MIIIFTGPQAERVVVADQWTFWRDPEGDMLVWFREPEPGSIGQQGFGVGLDYLRRRYENVTVIDIPEGASGEDLAHPNVYRIDLERESIVRYH